MSPARYSTTCRTSRSDARHPTSRARRACRRIRRRPRPAYWSCCNANTRFECGVSRFWRGAVRRDRRAANPRPSAAIGEFANYVIARPEGSQMPQSPELAGGAGHTFEDMVAARYLAALLGETGAPGIRPRRSRFRSPFHEASSGSGAWGANTSGRAPYELRSRSLAPISPPKIGCSQRPGAGGHRSPCGAGEPRFALALPCLRVPDALLDHR